MIIHCEPIEGLRHHWMSLCGKIVYHHQVHDEVMTNDYLLDKKSFRPSPSACHECGELWTRWAERTNEGRKMLARWKRQNRPSHMTPLRVLGELCYDRDVRHTIESVSTELLLEAFGHIEQRIIKAELLGNSRGRARLKWLQRWMTYINTELSRRPIPSAPQ